MSGPGASAEEMGRLTRILGTAERHVPLALLGAHARACVRKIKWRDFVSFLANRTHASTRPVFPQDLRGEILRRLLGVRLSPDDSRTNENE